MVNAELGTTLRKKKYEWNKIEFDYFSQVLYLSGRNEKGPQQNNESEKAKAFSGIGILGIKM